MRRALFFLAAASAAVAHVLPQQLDALDRPIWSVGATDGDQSSLAERLSSWLPTAKSSDDSSDGEGTLYDRLRSHPRTKRFAELVHKYPHVQELLQDKRHSLTVFAPTDDAVEHFPIDHYVRSPDEDGEPDKDERELKAERLLLHHLVTGEYPARLVLGSGTLPSYLRESQLGDEPQRLRVSLGLGGVYINFASRVLDIDIPASNGVIHLVDTVLPPPPQRVRTAALLPSVFSTLSLALERTGLGKDLNDLARKGHSLGGTLFAPSNKAFSDLPMRVQSWLFGGSKCGTEALRLLLSYHAVANHTVYTDAYYDGSADGKSEAATGGSRSRHVSLPTLLCGRPDTFPYCNLEVDVAWYLGVARMTVQPDLFRPQGGSGFQGRGAKVYVQNGISRDGVIQTIDRVLIPPFRHRHGKHSQSVEDESELTVESLAERLGLDLTPAAAESVAFASDL